MILVCEGDALDSGVSDHRRHDLIPFVTIDFVAEIIKTICDKIVFSLAHGIMRRRHGIVVRSHGLRSTDPSEKRHGCCTCVKTQVDVYRLVHLSDLFAVVDRRELL